MKRILSCWLMLACLTAQAATYYVDFDAGNDASAGTATGTAWKTIPGTRNVAATDWQSTTWGGGTISSASKVPAGTVFYLKSGSSHDTNSGGRILVDSTYYQPGTLANPITIQRSNSWGSGNVVFDGSGMTIAAYRGIVEFVNIPFILFDGISSSGLTITNSTASGLLCIQAGGTNGSTFRNIEIGNTTNAAVKIYSTQQSPLTNMYDLTLDTIIAHDGKGTDDTDSRIWVEFVDGFVITNCTAYISGIGADGIHTGSARNGWILNCVAHDNGEQGFDLSRDGSFKTNDWSFNITVRDCLSYKNAVNNFDHNSGTHNVVYINCSSWSTTSGDLGDAGFNVHEGTAGPNWWINCSTALSSDRGFNFGWASNPWSIPGGSYTQRVVNFISSTDNLVANGSSRGGSLWLDSDISGAGGVTSVWQVVNSILNTSGTTYGAVNHKTTIYTLADVEAGTFGTACTSNAPLWISTNITWEANNLNPGAGSPANSGGAWIFTASGSGSSSTALKLNTPYDVDARRVFRAGDRLRIESGEVVTVSEVTSSTNITLASTSSWSDTKGVWFVYAGTAPQIGAGVGGNLITVLATDAAASEPASTGYWTLYRDGDTSTNLVVLYAMTGTATGGGTDYATLSGTVTILAGASTAQVVLTPSDDSLVESSESCILTISANGAYTVGSPAADTITITSDDVVAVGGNGRRILPGLFP